MDFDAEQRESSRKLFAGPVSFELGVARWEDLPEAGPPEVGFAGRSNVGKSSLINALVGRRALARASGEPGRTRELNFFMMGEARLRLVDLPGYGYARAPKTAIKRWTGLMRDYLRGRQSLARVVLLIDARQGVMDNDVEVMDALDAAAVAYQAVLTKADKLTADALAARIDATRAALAKRPAAHPRLVTTSAETGLGIDDLRAEIAALAAPAP
jgi:GTP-binding protein